MDKQPTRGSAVTRVGCLLLLLTFTLAGCPCKKGTCEPTTDFPPLVGAEQQVTAADGGTVETWPEDQPELIYSVVFPPGSLSADATVTIQSPENDPANPCAARLTQASSFLTVNTGSAAVIDAIFLHIPYSDYDAANPPMPIMFAAGGTPLDVPVPSFSSGEITVAVPPQSGRPGWSIGLYDYVPPYQGPTRLDVDQGRSFDFTSDAPVVLLIHGCAGSPLDFRQGPAPTLYDFLSEAYNGRVWTAWYESIVTPADSSGARLVRAVDELEATHGQFPFEIDIVAHSMGGLIARYFVREDRGRHVRTVLFLGTPNDGTTREAAIWHWVSHRIVAENLDWINVDGLGFADNLHGSAFLGRLNTSLSLEEAVNYYTIAGDYTPENPYAPGPDDHFISTSSVDLQFVSHESVTLHEQQEVALYHGQLRQNYGNVFSLIADALGVNGDGPEPPEMVLVPDGVFMMGDPEAYCATEHRVTLTHDFYLGKYEVTNQEYLQAVQWAYNHNCVMASTASVWDNLDGSAEELLDLDDPDCEIAFSGGVFSLRSAGHGINPDHPVKEVTWYGAAAYCDWLSLRFGLSRSYDHSGDWSCNWGDPYGAEGYRLPTDAEWEYAAQCGDERIYPWGNESPDCSRANYGSCVAWTSSVGSCPAGNSSLGLSDLAGNVWEWCNDWWECDLEMAPEVSPAGPANGPGRVPHGGGWDSYTYHLRCAYRGSYGVTGYSNHAFGLRVARTAGP